MELWQLFAHQHWFTLRALGLELRLCARCSGYLVGFLSFTALGGVAGLPAFRTLPFQHQLLICAILTAPTAVDWLTQSLGLRESNNALRFITGASLGAVVSLYSSITSMPNSIPIFVSAMSAVAVVGLLGKLKGCKIDP
jgi:uncharacterized membrane protein